MTPSKPKGHFYRFDGMDQRHYWRGFRLGVYGGFLLGLVVAVAVALLALNGAGLLNP